MTGVYNGEPFRLDEQLGRVDWPVPRVVDVPPIRSGDCLVVCAGFEERSVEVMRRIHRHGIRGFELILITYLPRYPENRDREICNICQDNGIRVLNIVYDRTNPAGIGRKMAELVRGFNGVFIDISGMSRLLIVQVIVALLGVTCRRSVPIVLLYGEAMVYSPSEKEVIQADRDSNLDRVTSPSYMSSGIFEIATDVALSSVSMLGAEIRLVAFPSFDSIQLMNLVLELQPTHADIVYGVRSARENRWRKEAVRDLNRSIIETLRSCRSHGSSTLDYRETLMLLLRIYGERSMFDRIIIAPTGSKMQTVAVGLLRAVLYDVQIVYPTPREFPEPDRYTSGVRRLYSVDLPVGEIGRLVSDQFVG